MKKLHRISWFLLLVILLAVISGLSLAQENPDAVNKNLQRAGESHADLAPPSDVAQAVTEFSTAGDKIARDMARTFVGKPARTPHSAPSTTDACSQLIVNPTLDIVEFGDGYGSAEPWVVLDQIVYFDETIYTSPNYSLVLIDYDGGDTSPGIDTFAQGFYMPDNLTSVSIDYFSGMTDTNLGDLTFANIWTLDEEGYLDEWLFDWEIADSDESWTWWTLEFTNPDHLALMQGKVLAIRFESYTDNSFPGEWAYFDDITVEACTKNSPPTSGKIYLPIIIKKSNVAPAPICLPPTENPQDQYNANRGLVQTNATCNSNLSSLDRADYYAYTPTKSGDHTLKLTNLPAGTEWSAMMFFDTASPSYVPGPTGGDCRIGTVGAGDKQVTCNLQKNIPLIVKVSAGSTPVSGDYTMKITGP